MPQGKHTLPIEPGKPSNVHKRIRDKEKLRAAVRTVCLAEFEAFAGRAWDDDLGRWARPSEEMLQTEARARDVLKELRRALRHVSEFAGTVGGDTAARALRSFAPTARKLLAMRALGAPPSRRPRPDRAPTLPSGLPRVLPMNARTWLVSMWDRYRTSYGLTSPSLLTARHLAIISLLAGNWPELPTAALGHTPAKVIEREAKAMRRTIDHHRVPPAADSAPHGNLSHAEILDVALRGDCFTSFDLGVPVTISRKQPG